MTEKDIMKLFAKFDGEISMSDFSTEELIELYEAESGEDLPVSFKEKYFAKYNDIKTHTINKKYDW